MKPKIYKFNNKKPTKRSLWDGDGIELTKFVNSFDLECCDCGLKHVVDVDFVKEKVILKFYRKDGS